MKKILLLAMALCALPCLGQTALTCTNSVTIGGQAQQGPAFYSIQLTSGDACALNFTPPGSGNVAQQITLKIYQSASAPYTGSVTTGTGLAWQGSAPTVPGTASALVIANCLLDNTGAVCSVPGGGGGSSGDGVSYQASYPQSDFGGRANACIIDAEKLTNGNKTHICNAQGDTSTSAAPAYITSQVNCGDTAGDPVTWILPYGYIHMSGFTGGTSSGILRYTGCRMMTQAPIVASSTLGNIAHLRIIDTSTSSGLYAMYSEATGTGSVSPFSEMSGILFDSNGQSFANPSNAVIILNIGNDRSYDHDFDVTYAVAGQIGILFGGSSSAGTATCCSYVLQRVTTNGNFTAGTGLAIHGYVAQAAVYDSTFGHTASGSPEITCTNDLSLQIQMDFFNIYGEESNDTTTPFVQDNGCTRLSFHGVTARPGATNSTAPFLSMVTADGAWTIDGLSMTSFGSSTFTYPATAVSNAVSGSNCATAPGTPCLLKTDANGQMGEWGYNPGQGYNKQQTCGAGLYWAGGAIPAGTYTVGAKCFNNFGTTYYITGVTCYSDNSGTSTANVADNSSNALLTGAITASPSWVAGTQRATKSIANGAWTAWTFVADGTSTIIQCSMQTIH